MRVLVVGGGGREHAIAWKVSQSPYVDEVYCAPGNGGTELEEKCINVDITDIDKLADFAYKEKIGLTVVGPEVPLVDGIVEKFREKKLKIFGPAKEAARLEGSKAYSKDFMKKYGVKTAAYEVFTDFELAEKYIETCEYPVVIKADGLAAGKGVIICHEKKEAEEALKDLMINDVFNGSGKKVVVEEFLTGVEASILSVTDGKTIIPLLSAKDHKTIYENNQGPNTGGMGAISPNPYCTEKVIEQFKKDIMEPTLKGIQAEGLDYKGIIFFGLMINEKGTYLLEYNVRMGDPETQSVLPLMKSDFTDVMLKAVEGRLSEAKIEWEEGYCCNVVAAAGGYPMKYNKGDNINGITDCEGKVFIAGAKFDGALVTNGGRVLCVANKGKTLEEAIEATYADIKKIDFKDMYYRKDIGKIY